VNQIGGWKTHGRPIFFTPETSSGGPWYRDKPRLAANLVHPRDKHVGVRCTLVNATRMDSPVLRSPSREKMVG
jgi:hypothetical protein